MLVQRIYILYFQASCNIWLILYWYCKENSVLVIHGSWRVNWFVTTQERKAIITPFNQRQFIGTFFLEANSPRLSGSVMYVKWFPTQGSHSQTGKICTEKSRILHLRIHGCIFEIFFSSLFSFFFFAIWGFCEAILSTPEFTREMQILS